MNVIKIIIILCLCGICCDAQTIEKFSIDSGGTQASNGNLQVLYTLGEVNIREASAGNVQISEGFINASLSIKLSPKVFLQGPSLNPSTAGLMNDHLRTLSFLPSVSPYPDGAICNPSVFLVTGNNAIVDWVWIELRAVSNNTQIVKATSALLQRDGDVVALDGVSNLNLNVAPGNYYVVVNHRNHLGAMSSTAISLNESSATLIDFTSDSFNTYGNYARTQLTSGLMALWSGDTNMLNRIRFLGADSSASAIKDQVLADPSNGFGSITYSSLGYYNTDLDLNGTSKYTGSGSDTNIIRDNVLSHPANGFGSPTYTITETIPNN